MNPYTKAALFLIRLIGSGGIIISLAYLLGNAAAWMAHHPIDPVKTLALECIPLVIGIIILCVSRPVAKRLTARFTSNDDEESGEETQI